jgi:hypothetical protein
VFPQPHAFCNAGPTRPLGLEAIQCGSGGARAHGQRSRPTRSEVRRWREAKKDCGWTRKISAMSPRRSVAVRYGSLAIIAGCGLAIGCVSARQFPRSEEYGVAGPLAAAYEEQLSDFRSQLRIHENWERSLMADKSDLLLKLASAEAERDDLKRRAFLTESTLATQRTEIVDRNNPFHELNVRRESQFDDCRNLEEFLASASEIIGRQTELYGLPSGSSRAVLSMLLVSGIFEFGQAAPHDGSPGCVSNSVRAIRGEDEQIRFRDYQRAKFGCCVDFSVLLIELLRHQNIPCELRMSHGHALVEAQLEKTGTLLLDPSFSLAVRGIDSRPDENLVIYRFPVKDSSRKVPLQFQTVMGMTFSLEGMTAKDLIPVDYSDICTKYGIRIRDTDVRSD